jgi:diamine N-acetyltransferase
MQKPTKHVQLVPVDASNWRQTLTLNVQPEQLHFVAAYAPIAAIAMAKAYVSADNKHWQPYACYDHELMLGFVALAYSATQPEHVWICHFFIDQRYQGQGYGSAALRAILAQLRTRTPACRSAHLLVHPDNTHAQGLYQAHGFRPTGRMIEGEPHYRYDFEQQ